MKNSNIKKIVVIGATGGSADVGDIIKDINKINNEFDILGYLDDNESLWGKIVYDIIVLGGTDLIETFDDDVHFISGIGNQENFKNKPEIINKWGKKTNKFATLIHPSAVISSTSNSLAQAPFPPDQQRVQSRVYSVSLSRLDAIAVTAICDSLSK